MKFEISCKLLFTKSSYSTVKNWMTIFFIQPRCQHIELNICIVLNRRPTPTYPHPHPTYTLNVKKIRFDVDVVNEKVKLATESHEDMTRAL